MNIYSIPTDVEVTAGEVENEYVEVVKSVKSAITIPVAVKLSPFFTNFANVAKRLVDAGADGLVLFNRFYQPDIDLETLEVTPNILFSTPMAMRLPLRWVAILHGRVPASLAATSGIHRATDVIKMLMVGADVTMLVLGDHASRHQADRRHRKRNEDVDGGARIRIRAATQRQPEPEELRRSERLTSAPNTCGRSRRFRLQRGKRSAAPGSQHFRRLRVPHCAFAFVGEIITAKKAKQSPNDAE